MVVMAVSIYLGKRRKVGTWMPSPLDEREHQILLQAYFLGYLLLLSGFFLATGIDTLQSKAHDHWFVVMFVGLLTVPWINKILQKVE